MPPTAAPAARGAAAPATQPSGPATTADREAQKRAAGEAAGALVRDGMVVGLGTGSTVKYTILDLARRVKGGLDIVGIPTSVASERLAREHGIRLSTLDEHPDVDLTIDGADEVDDRLNLIKGGGGALTREKIVAAQSRRMVVVADEAKHVEKLGSTFPLPIEVLPFAATPVRRFVEELGADVDVRRTPDARPVVTDNGNWILDAKWVAIEQPAELEQTLECRPGVVCSGLFIGLCSAAYVAGPGGVKTLGNP